MTNHNHYLLRTDPNGRVAVFWMSGKTTLGTWLGTYADEDAARDSLAGFAPAKIRVI